LRDCIIALLLEEIESVEVDGTTKGTKNTKVFLRQEEQESTERESHDGESAPPLTPFFVYFVCFVVHIHLRAFVALTRSLPLISPCGLLVPLAVSPATGPPFPRTFPRADGV